MKLFSLQWNIFLSFYLNINVVTTPLEKVVNAWILFFSRTCGLNYAAPLAIERHLIYGTGLLSRFLFHLIRLHKARYIRFKVIYFDTFIKRADMNVLVYNQLCRRPCLVIKPTNLWYNYHCLDILLNITTHFDANVCITEQCWQTCNSSYYIPKGCFYISCSILSGPGGIFGYNITCYYPIVWIALPLQCCCAASLIWMSLSVYRVNNRSSVTGDDWYR